jgi:hypothetical protein
MPGEFNNAPDEGSKPFDLQKDGKAKSYCMAGPGQ